MQPDPRNLQNLLPLAIFAFSALAVRWFTVRTLRSLIGVSVFTGIACGVTGMLDRTAAADLWHFFYGALFCIMYGLFLSGSAEPRDGAPVTDAEATSATAVGSTEPERHEANTN